MKCRWKGCDVILSRYNMADRLCWFHRQERQRMMFLRGIEKTDTLTEEERRRYLEGRW